MAAEAALPALVSGAGRSLLLFVAFRVNPACAKHTPPARQLRKPTRKVPGVPPPLSSGRIEVLTVRGEGRGVSG